MKSQLLDAEAELSCAFANLQSDPPRVTEARERIGRVQAMLLELAQVIESTEAQKPPLN